jgi:hypothetical protein
MLVTIVDLRINGRTVYFEIQRRLQKSAEAGGQVSQPRQLSLMSGTFSVHVEKRKPPEYGTRSLHCNTGAEVFSSGTFNPAMSVLIVFSTETPDMGTKNNEALKLRC